jgi:AcrR family transcriptional regulator
MTPRSPSDAAGRQRRRYAPRMPPEQRRQQLLDAALHVILSRGYEGVSIEAIAKTAGVTRPVIYDHFTNLGQLLQALIEREELSALGQLADVVPEALSDTADLAQTFASGVGRFLAAVVARPSSWRLILLPPEGTPATVRDQVAKNRSVVQSRIQALITWANERSGALGDLDTEVAARAIRSLSEEAGRMVLTDPDNFPPERYERFALGIMRLIWRA